MPRCWAHEQPPSNAFAPVVFLPQGSLPDQLLPLLFLITRPGFTAAFLDRLQRAPVWLNMPPKSVPPPAFPVSVNGQLPYTKALVSYTRNLHAILHSFLWPHFQLITKSFESALSLSSRVSALTQAHDTACLDDRSIHVTPCH